MSAEVNDAVKIEIDYEDKKCLLFPKTLKYVASRPWIHSRMNIDITFERKIITLPIENWESNCPVCSQMTLKAILH